MDPAMTNTASRQKRPPACEPKRTSDLRGSDCSAEGRPQGVSCLQLEYRNRLPKTHGSVFCRLGESGGGVTSGSCSTVGSAPHAGQRRVTRDAGPGDVQGALAESFEVIQRLLGAPGAWAPPERAGQ
jgi:hypothetical protein